MQEASYSIASCRVMGISRSLARVRTYVMLLHRTVGRGSHSHRTLRPRAAAPLYSHLAPRRLLKNRLMWLCLNSQILLIADDRVGVDARRCINQSRKFGEAGA